jgi:hypothetical protein
MGTETYASGLKRAVTIHILNNPRESEGVRPPSSVEGEELSIRGGAVSQIPLWFSPAFSGNPRSPSSDFTH